MRHAPSIKGTVLVDLVEDVRKLLPSGDREAAARLTEQDRATVEQDVSQASWYPVGFYARLMELLRDVHGDGRNEYVIDRGRVRGRKLMEAGVYQQMEYVGRLQAAKAITPEERFAAYGRDLRLLVTLSRSILNFTTWSVRADPDVDACHIIEVSDAEEFPDILGYSTEGFIDAMASIPGHSGLWKYARLSRSLAAFRMTRSR